MRFHTIYESSRGQGKHPPMLMAFAGRHRNVFRTQIPKSHVAPCCTRNSLIDLARSAQFRNGQLPGSDSHRPLHFQASSGYVGSRDWGQDINAAGKCWECASIWGPPHILGRPYVASAFTRTVTRSNSQEYFVRTPNS
jgi:hypothetical protein